MRRNSNSAKKQHLKDSLSDPSLRAGLIDMIMNDPLKRATMLELINSQKGAIEEYKKRERLKQQSPAEKLKRKFVLESPTSLQRRRALEEMESTSSGGSSGKSAVITPKRTVQPSAVASSPSVPFGRILEKVIAFVEVKSHGEDRSDGVKALLHKMGARIVEQFSREVTHVIFKDGAYLTYQKAKLMKIHLVSILWLDMCRTLRCKAPECDYPALGGSNTTEDVNKICDKLQNEYTGIERDEDDALSQHQIALLDQLGEINDITSSQDIIPDSQDVPTDSEGGTGCGAVGSSEDIVVSSSDEVLQVTQIRAGTSKDVSPGKRRRTLYSSKRDESPVVNSPRRKTQAGTTRTPRNNSKSNQPDAVNKVASLTKSERVNKVAKPKGMKCVSLSRLSLNDGFVTSPNKRRRRTLYQRPKEETVLDSEAKAIVNSVLKSLSLTDSKTSPSVISKLATTSDNTQLNKPADASTSSVGGKMNKPADTSTSLIGSKMNKPAEISSCSDDTQINKSPDVATSLVSGKLVKPADVSTSSDGSKKRESLESVDFSKFVTLRKPRTVKKIPEDSEVFKIPDDKPVRKSLNESDTTERLSLSTEMSPLQLSTASSKKTAEMQRESFSPMDKLMNNSAISSLIKSLDISNVSNSNDFADIGTKSTPKDAENTGKSTPKAPSGSEKKPKTLVNFKGNVSARRSMRILSKSILTSDDSSTGNIDDSLMTSIENQSLEDSNNKSPAVVVGEETAKTTTESADKQLPVLELPAGETSNKGRGRRKTVTVAKQPATPRRGGRRKTMFGALAKDESQKDDSLQEIGASSNDNSTDATQDTVKIPLGGKSAAPVQNTAIIPSTGKSAAPSEDTAIIPSRGESAAPSPDNATILFRGKAAASTEYTATTASDEKSDAPLQDKAAIASSANFATSAQDNTTVVVSNDKSALPPRHTVLRGDKSALPPNDNSMEGVDELSEIIVPPVEAANKGRGRRKTLIAPTASPRNTRARRTTVFSTLTDDSPLTESSSSNDRFTMDKPCVRKTPRRKTLAKTAPVLNETRAEENDGVSANVTSSDTSKASFYSVDDDEDASMNVRSSLSDITNKDADLSNSNSARLNRASACDGSLLTDDSSLVIEASSISGHSETGVDKDTTSNDTEAKNVDTTSDCSQEKNVDITSDISEEKNNDTSSDISKVKDKEIRGDISKANNEDTTSDSSEANNTSNSSGNECSKVVPEGSECSSRFSLSLDRVTSDSNTTAKDTNSSEWKSDESKRSAFGDSALTSTKIIESQPTEKHTENENIGNVKNVKANENNCAVKEVNGKETIGSAGNANNRAGNNAKETTSIAANEKETNVKTSSDVKKGETCTKRKRKLYNPNDSITYMREYDADQERQERIEAIANKNPSPPIVLTALTKQFLQEKLDAEQSEEEAEESTEGSDALMHAILAEIKKTPKSKKKPPKRAEVDPELDEQRDLLKEFVGGKTAQSDSDLSLPIKRLARRSTLDFVQAQTPTQSQKRTQRAVKLPSIVCTRFHRDQVVVFRRVVKRLGRFLVQTDVGERTTHLISAEPVRTINILRGIARGIWILKAQWLYDSEKAGHWLPEEEYELTEFSPAVQQCRMERQTFGSLHSMDIFEDCGKIHVFRTPGPKHADLEELIRLARGTVVDSLRGASIAVGKHVEREGVVCVSFNWILDSVSENTRKDYEKYLLKKT